MVVEGLEHLIKLGIDSSHLIHCHSIYCKRLVCEPSEDDPLYHQFVSEYETNYENAKMAWYLKKVQREMKQELFVHKKITVAINMINRLRDEMDDPQYNDLLHYHVNENFQRRIPKEKPLIMNVRWVEDMFKKALTHPSSVRGKKVKELVSRLLKKKANEKDFSWWENQRLVVKYTFMNWGRMRLKATAYEYEANYTDLRERTGSYRRNDTLSRNPFNRNDGYRSD